MRNKKLLIGFFLCMIPCISILFCAIVYAIIAKGDAYGTARNYLQNSAQIAKQTGGVENMYLNPFGFSTVRCVGDICSAELGIKVVGKQNSLTLQVTMSRKDQAWKIEQVIYK